MISTRPLVEIRLEHWLNLAWGVLTFLLLGIAFIVWPAELKTWVWGLIVGACLGAGGVFGVGFAYSAIQRKNERTNHEGET